MQISVECGGFTRAAEACLTANQTSAVLTESLAGRLGELGGMAGNDATSEAFATSYDAGAREALTTLADLTHAFIGAGRLLATTGDNHAAAEAAAAGVDVSAYDGGGGLDDSYVRVRPAVPPSSLGGDEPALGRVDAWILDQIEGFVWPGADVDALRGAASAWRRAAASTAGLADQVDAAIALLETQRSPEIPLAVDALGDLATLVGDAAWQLSSLAVACEDYAAAVEEVHARTRALLSEVAQMVVEGAAISVIVGGLTGGLGGGAAAAAAAARVRSQAPRFFALLAALRAGIVAVGARVDRVRDDLALVRSKLERFVRVPVRGERGSMKPPGGWGRSSPEPGWLTMHEVPPGHTLERHVGKTVEELTERLRIDGRRQASSFADQASAERSVEAVMERYAKEIAEWQRSGGSDRLVLSMDTGRATGVVAVADGRVLHTTGVRVVLIPGRNDDGWQILTAFPN